MKNKQKNIDRETEEATDFDEFYETLDDGLGAARGLWSAIKLVAGFFLSFLWLGASVKVIRSGEWETYFLGTVFLAAAVTAFRMLELRYPKDKKTAFSVTIICLTLAIGFLT